MIAGIGTDIISVERIHSVILRRKGRFLNRIFTPQEREYCRSKKFPWIHFAGRFAAKESVFKVLESGWSLGVRWQDVEILPAENGEPRVTLRGKAKYLAEKRGITQILVSISHNRKYAIATAVGERDDERKNNRRYRLTDREAS
ncbi:MAG TPA: holo-[acyl-carrier-protein] synthase [Candidatus Omnitrophica bacterium]|nr:holo-[acyl-carrier-protein] synthase [Candidatus Omnitrophota bacterium]